ncbi:minor histocompatibility antigen H13-like isoform X1 [Arapaima gigas]
MADVEQGDVGSASLGGTEPVNGTAQFVSTAEGTALAYGSLVLMALLPIFFGALRSVGCSKSKNSSDMPETITSRDAAKFPIIASCTLFGLYLFFKASCWQAYCFTLIPFIHIFSEEYINLLLSVYFFVLGILALSHTMSPLMNKIFPSSLPNRQYQLLFTQGSGENKEEIVNYEFDTKDLVCLGISSVVGVWYLLKKHWIANNVFGLAFALNGVELLHLNNVSTGCILLGGLFMYDVFWVFGTNVMVTVAKSFEAPIKLVFPRDLLERGLEASNFAMLGLGDIVIPGIFIALLLRFDVSLKKNTQTYFYTSFLAYIFGLGLTMFIMHTFKHAQPALLYLVPACIGFPVTMALVKGELTEMFSYESSEEILPHTPRLTRFPTGPQCCWAGTTTLPQNRRRQPRKRRRDQRRRRTEGISLCCLILFAPDGGAAALCLLRSLSRVRASYSQRIHIQSLVVFYHQTDVLPKTMAGF